MMCDKCDVSVPDSVVATCWADRHTPDHVGLCCNCFDVSLGMRPPVVLGLRTAARLDNDDDDVPMA